MSPSDFQSIASAVYGARWQSALSRDMGIALRTIQRWARDGIGKTSTAEGVRRFLEERRVARIVPPPAGSTPEQDRDDECRDAIDASVGVLVSAALDMGWSEPEIWTAILAATIDRIHAGAGALATIALLELAIAGLRNGNGDAGGYVPELSPSPDDAADSDGGQ